MCLHLSVARKFRKDVPESPARITPLDLTLTEIPLGESSTFNPGQQPVINAGYISDHPGSPDWQTIEFDDPPFYQPYYVQRRSTQDFSIHESSTFNPGQQPVINAGYISDHPGSPDWQTIEFDDPPFYQPYYVQRRSTQDFSIHETSVVNGSLHDNAEQLYQQRHKHDEIAVFDPRESTLNTPIPTFVKLVVVVVVVVVVAVIVVVVVVVVAVVIVVVIIVVVVVLVVVVVEVLVVVVLIVLVVVVLVVVVLVVIVVVILVVALPSIQSLAASPVEGVKSSTPHVIVKQPQRSTTTDSVPDGRPWSYGLFDCTGDRHICLQGTFCSPCLSCRVSRDLEESAWVPCCVPYWLLVLRTKLRAHQDIAVRNAIGLLHDPISFRD
ncbi:placenta-specific gene 8 protein [Elysia marginata]|uniref:Placenta-specific gene 8 protein n=1 Tax=Elysia marginata TaxID=1093978 RepID=A0AAV4G9F1_9GAST|nr:placenta-specific gene 8 protein [Elysia marginata]